MSDELESASVEIEGKKYTLEFNVNDPNIAPGLTVAFCDQLVRDQQPIILDPWDHGKKPYPPDFVASRLIIDSAKERLCILYEVYWRKQDCTWRELNKDHDHDYEQVQIHFNLSTGEKDKVVISSVGPVECAGHGVECYSNIIKARVRTIEYTTSPKNGFPWGGELGCENATQLRDIPIKELSFENGRPVILVANCYHVFIGLKTHHQLEKLSELAPVLKRLDQGLTERWYYLHVKNRFGHDISNPFEEPYVMYYPPPEDFTSRLFYRLVWFLAILKRIFK